MLFNRLFRLKFRVSEEDIQIVENSSFFDKDWYVATYANLRVAPAKAAFHYMSIGWKKKLDPSPLFCTSDYIEMYESQLPPNTCPLFFFETTGKDLSHFTSLAQQRNCLTEIEKIFDSSIFFNTDWYLKQNPDVAMSGIDPRHHYYFHGWKEGRNPSSLFETKKYLAESFMADSAMKELCPLVHYEKLKSAHHQQSMLSSRFYRSELLNYFRIYESNLFDAKWYLQKYPDVKNAGLDPITHYIRYGWKEFRDPSPNFCTQVYIEKNESFPSGMCPLFHYICYGKSHNFIVRMMESGADNYRQIIQNSRYFDSDWYLKNNIDVASAGIDPAKHYLKFGWKTGRNPSRAFSTTEYLEINPDVAVVHINPLIHYEKWGWKEGRIKRYAEIKDFQFPMGTLEMTETVAPITSSSLGRVAVFASFSGNGCIEDYVVELLRGIKTIADAIVFVADNPIFPEQLKKIRPFVSHFIFKRHNEYDFGSYKRGFLFLNSHGLLNQFDELLFCNDSCYGPVFPFVEAVESMKNRRCDFWGLTLSKASSEVTHAHIQSFFYVFKRHVYTSSVFSDFLLGVKRQISPSWVVTEYEMKFTHVLQTAGFSCDTYIDINFSDTYNAPIPTKKTLSLLRDFRMPLAKIKVLMGSSVEAPEAILDFIRQKNSLLFDCINEHLLNKIKSRNTRKDIPVEYGIDLQFKHYEKIHRQIKNRFCEGKKIRVCFLVAWPTMFPAKPLYDLLLTKAEFDAKIVVIPDVRFGYQKGIDDMHAAHKALSQELEHVELAFDEKNNSFVDITENCDLVCYPLPYRFSIEQYNLDYIFRKSVLPFHINYGFFRSKYDRLILQTDYYNFFWKVYVETDYNWKEYEKFGIASEKNAVLSGYCKMDELAKYGREKRTRKTILIAPHHSIDKGFNKVLALSNFEKYADLFVKLPKLYPDIDFVFRPHPALFISLAKSGLWDEQQVDEYIQKLTSYPNMRISSVRNYFEDFVQSDGIIQDCGSFLVEYFYTKMPCCYMLKSPDDIRDKFTDLGIKCLNECYIAYTESDIQYFLDDVINNNNDTKKESRMRLANEIMKNFPNVSTFISNDILGSFDDGDSVK